MEAFIIIVFAVISLMTIQSVNGECGHYANSPTDTCLEGKQHSNYFYCNGTNFLYWKQFATGDCSGPPSSDIPLCDPDTAYCVGSCAMDPCPYVSQSSYSGTCDRNTDDWNEVAFIMDYCHNYTTLYPGLSFIFECDDINQLKYTSYIGDSCSGTLTSSAIFPIDVYLPMPWTDCVYTDFVSNDCNVNETSVYVVGPDNIQCAVHANRPLEVCYGNYDPVGVSYSNYFYCSNQFLYWKQYGNTNCSDVAAYDGKLCNSRFSECPTRCDDAKCEYMVQRRYGSGGNSCDKDTDNWSEVTYAVGYCVDLTFASLKVECNNNGGLTYTAYTDTACTTVNAAINIELTGYPTVVEDTCTVTSIYVTCPEPPSEAPTEQPSESPTKNPVIEPTEQPSTSPIDKVDGNGALGRCSMTFAIYWLVMLAVCTI